MNNWWFRTKPRSIIKTFEWLKHFNALDGENWNEKIENVSSFNQKNVMLTRRRYIYSVHRDFYADKNISFEDFISGQFDENEVESTGRNDKTTFEFFGLAYVDKEGIIHRTKAGQLIESDKADENLLLKQLLKVRFPSPVISKVNKGSFVFPLEVILKVFEKLDGDPHFETTLNKFELGFCFMCIDIKDIDTLISAIRFFRENYLGLKSKDNATCIKLFERVMAQFYPHVKNQASTFYKDYADALVRTLEYTGLFASRGRGDYVKLYIPEHARLKTRLLQSKYTFIVNPESDYELYMQWFGDPFNVKLPWESTEELSEIIKAKFEIIQTRLNQFNGLIESNVSLSLLTDIDLLKQDALRENLTVAEKRQLDLDLSSMILGLNERYFVDYESKTPDMRKEICEKFEDINFGNEDKAALWLEVNTWRSLVAIRGNHAVKRNFKIEEDLTPRAFAPGIGNTPDMEVYSEDIILIPEVSLMSGVKQWEHEGSSVIDHVFKFIKAHSNKSVLGLFITKSLNERSLWQFFILNKNSWIGRPVPVIPMTINQYLRIIENIYARDYDFNDLVLFLNSIHEETKKLEDYSDWYKVIEQRIALFCS